MLWAARLVCFSLQELRSSPLGLVARQWSQARKAQEVPGALLH